MEKSDKNGASPAGSGLRKHVSIAVGIAVSGALLALAVRNVRVSEVMSSLSGVRVPWLLVMAGTFAVDLAIRSTRWKLLLSSAAPRAPLPRLVELESIGMAVNNVLFLRIGELVRSALAAKELGVPFVSVFSTIVVERVLDLMSLLALFGAAVWLYPAFFDARIAWIAAGGACALAGGLAVLSAADLFIHDASWERRLSALPRLYALASQIAQGARSLRSRKAPAIVALGFALWIIDAGFYWAGGIALRLSPALSFGKAVLVLASSAAGAFLPAVPGSFGAFEQAVKWLLMRLGVAEGAALAFAGLTHVWGYVLSTGVGIVFLYRAGHTIAGLKELGRSMKREGAVS